MIELKPRVFITLLLYAISFTTADFVGNPRAHRFYDDQGVPYQESTHIAQRRLGRSTRTKVHKLDDEPPENDRSSRVSRHLFTREAKHKAAKAAASPPPQKPADTKKQQKQEQKNEKKAKDAAAKAEKQKGKDQKMVNDNLNREKKAQEKAGAAAAKNVQKIQNNYNKDIDKENKRLSKEQGSASKNLAKAEREAAKQKGHKGEKKALEKLAASKSAVSNIPKAHDGRLQQMGQKTAGDLSKNMGNLNKGLTKAHTNEFDANGRAKEHLNGWQKFKKVAKKIVVEGAMALGGAVLSVIPGGAVAFAGITAARVAAQAAIRAGIQGAKQGVKQGVKQGTKQGTKQGKKQAKDQATKDSGPPPVDWRAQNAQQIADSQKNKDSQINNVQNVQNSLLDKIKKNPGAKITRREYELANKAEQRSRVQIARRESIDLFYLDMEDTDEDD